MSSTTERFIRLYEDLVDMFHAMDSPTPRVGAVVVTASGKRIEKLQRLITPWDVLGGGGE